MKGKKVKEILTKEGITSKYLAEILQESPQNISAMLKVEDIKTGVLERIARAIGKDLSFFFRESNIPLNAEKEDRLLSIIESQQRTIENLTLK